MTGLWLGTSWKMNKTLAEARAWCAAVRETLGDGPEGATLFVIPPFTALTSTVDALDGAPWRIGVQNVHWEDGGAWTGEISAPMAKDAGATLAEIGHSERRRWFGETDETVGWKVAAADRAGLTPLVCVGEPARNPDVADAALAVQVRAALAPGARVVLAYEPVWAIGVGAAPADPGYVADRVAALRALAPAQTPILYGGSIDAATARPMLDGARVDGLFVGRAALDPLGFADIVAAATA